MAELEFNEDNIEQDNLSEFRAEPSTELAIVISDSAEDEESRKMVEAYVFMRKALGKLKINEQDRLGFSALHYSVTQKKLSMVKLLVKNGADVEIRDALGFTPVFYACGRAANLEIATYLIEQCNASISCRTDAGMTCLHCAAYVGAKELVKLLLKHGADPQASSNDGSTPFDSAKTSPEIQGMLHEANRKANASLERQRARCAKCGKVRDKLMRCARCHVTLYCGKECQKEHWKKGGHKQQCEEGVLAQPSRYPFMTTISNMLRADRPTVSLHGGKTEDYIASQDSIPIRKSFVVKVQRPISPAGPKDLMVYNIDKSVHVFIREETVGYENILQKITVEGIWGLKAFFWAEKVPQLGEGVVRVFPGKFAPEQDW